MVTDWFQARFEDMRAALIAGNDLPDADRYNATTGKYTDYTDLLAGGNYGELVWAMRLAAHRICYTAVQSNAMNGISSLTKIVPLTPWWMTMLTTLNIVFGILTAIGVCLYLLKL